jgi:hypothetical protein
MVIRQDTLDVIRKGQFIVNYLRFKLRIPEEDHPSYLFGLHDEEFEKMEHEYRKYVIAALHSPDGGKKELTRIFGNPVKMKRKVKAKSAS